MEIFRILILQLHYLLKETQSLIGDNLLKVSRIRYPKTKWFLLGAGEGASVELWYILWLTSVFAGSLVKFGNFVPSVHQSSHKVFLEQR